MVDEEPYDVFRRIKRGLSGYVSYLAACEMNDAFSEYVLYEPILRILMARGFTAESEVECSNIQQPETGDKKRIDFVARKGSLCFAIEVKWALTVEQSGKLKKKAVDVSSYLSKIAAFAGCSTENRAFLCVFGRGSAINYVVNFVNNTVLLRGLKDFGDTVIADMAQPKYGCRVYEFVVVSGDALHENH